MRLAGTWILKSLISSGYMDKIIFLDLESSVDTLSPLRPWPQGGPADVVRLPLTSLFFQFNGVWSCLCRLSLWNLQMVLADAQLGPPQCFLFSTGDHCTAGLVLAGRVGVGRGVGGCWEIWLSCLEWKLTHGAQRKCFDLWIACAGMAEELQDCAVPGEKFVGTGLTVVLNFHLQDGNIFRFRPWRAFLCASLWDGSENCLHSRSGGELI